MRALRLPAFLAIVCSFVASAFAQQVGDKIVVRSERARLRSVLEMTGTVPQGAILVIKNINDDWFWVIFSSGDSGTVKGWINRADVIPCSQAMEFFNEDLKRRPNANAYNTRGLLWSERGDHDLAIADFDKAIR